MRVSPRLFALLVGAFGLAALLFAREGTRGCPLGACPSCGACFRPPPAVQESGYQEISVA